MLRKMMGFLLAASVFAGGSATAVQTGPGPFDTDAVSFARVSTPDGIFNTITKRSFYWDWGAPQYKPAAHHFGYYQASTAKPSAATGQTQYWKFTMKSEGLFTHEPCAHLAFMARWDGDFGATYNRGRGFTVGDAVAPCTTFPGMASTQAELFFSSSNLLLADRQTNVLSDYKEYEVEIHVADDGFAYWITDPVTNTVLVNHYHYVPDDTSADWSFNQLTAQGIALGLVGAGSTSLWRFTISNFRFGWF
jgi:hypothetical protein